MDALAVMAGPVAGAIGGFLGGMPFRSLAIRRGGIAAGVVVALLVADLGLGVGSLKLGALGVAGQFFAVPLLFAALVSFGLGLVLKLSNSLANVDLAQGDCRVFISYRRSDSGDIAERIHDRLREERLVGHVYFDQHSIPPGVDFRTHIESMIKDSTVFLVVIGPTWLNVQDDDGKPRLHNENDIVAREIESALDLKVKTIPVLVGGASMPEQRELPKKIQELAFRTAAEVRRGPSFHRDVDRLVEQIAKTR